MKTVRNQNQTKRCPSTSGKDSIDSPRVNVQLLQEISGFRDEIERVVSRKSGIQL